MATGQLMFEVGIKSAQEQLDKIKQEFTKANGDLQKLLNLKVSIDGVDAVTKALNQIGDTTALRNLRNEIAALNREFSILSKGAGGSGDIAGRGLAADIERTSQSIERYTSKIKQLTEERTRLVGGTRNSSYQIFTDKILSYELSLEGARKKLAELNEQKNKPVASEPLKKATQDAQTFETALGRIETAISGLKSGMNVNLTGDFSKWAQEVQSVTVSVRELVEQFKQLQQVQAKTGGDTAIKSQTEEYKREEEVLNNLVQKLEYYKRARERAEKTISDINSQYPNGFAQPWKDPAVHAAIQQDRELQEKTVASLDSKWDAFWKKHETQAVQFAQMLGKSLDGVTIDDFYKHASGKFQDLAKSWYATFHSQGYDKTFLFDPDHEMKLLERLKELRKLKNEYKDSATFQRVDPNSAAELQLLESLKRKIDEYQNARNKAFSADPNQTAAMEKLYAAEAKHGEASAIVAAAKEKEAQFTKEVAQQQQKLNELQSRGASTQTTQGGLFDPQKFNTLQEAIDKIISEINRLQQAFTKLGENSSLSNLSTTINGLAVTLSSLSNAIKIQPLDEQVKALLERCEKAEAKLREVGDAAKYLNERAGAKTQQKASSIMGITGTEEEQLNKVSSTAERFARLLVEIENQMAKIGKIQAFGEQSGFSPTLLKNAQNQLEALHKMVQSTFKGTPVAEGLIIPASDSQLAQFIQQFGLLKAQYRDIISEAERFNKTTSKETSDAAKNAERENKKWADSMDYAKTKANELRLTIEKMERIKTVGNNLGLDTSSLSAQIDRLKQNLSTLYGMMGGSKIGGTAQEFVKSSAFKIPLADANTASNILKSSDAYKEASANIKKAESEANKLKVTISNLESFAHKAEVMGIDTAKLRAQIDDLKIYKQTLDNIASGRDRQSVKKFVSADWFLETKREIKDATSSIKKEMSNALKPDNEGVNALKEYVSLLRQISSLTNTANRGAALGLDVQTLRNQIALLEQYAKKIEQFAVNKGVGFNAWMQATPVYGEARMNIAADQAKMNTAIANAKHDNTNATTQLSDSEQRLANAIKGSTDSMRGQSQVLSDLKMMAMQYLSVWGAQSFINSIIETGGQLEQQRLSLSAILGDMEKASTLFGQIKELALKSPFGVVELDKMSKQLAAYSFEYEELFDWTKRLADISAATGTSVDRLALALGHVRSEGALSGYTLRQFAMANVPVLRMLSENLGISSKEVRERVKKKEISAEDVQDILKQLTEDGGMFANAQETMSEALNAKFKNLRDAFDIMYGEIAEGGVGDKLKELAVVLTQGAKHWERLGKDVLMVAAALGMGKVAMLLYNKAVGEGTAATLKSAFAAKEREVANLKLARSYRTLTVEEEAELAMQRKWWSFGSKLNSRNIMVLLSTNKLTVAQLERAVAMGKVSKADAIAAMNLLKLNTVQMQSVKVFGFWGRIGATIANGFRMASLAVKSFAASVAPLLALTAIFELWNRRNEQKDAAKSMSSAMAGVAPGQAAFDIRGSLASSNKLSEEALKNNIEEMKNALIASNAYTDSLKKQIDATDDVAKKYDLLKGKIGEVADKYEELKASQEKMLEDAWDAGGGFLSDNMATDAKDFDAAFVEYTKALTIGSKQIKETLKKWMEIQGIWKDEFSQMTGKQLFEQLSEQDASRFLAGGDKSVYRGRGYDEATREALEKIAEARKQVGDKLAEMKGEQGQEFADTLKAMYEEAFHVDLDKATDEQKIAFDKWLRETIGRAEGLSKDAKEALRNIVIDFTIKLVPHYQVEKPQTAQDVIDQQIGDNKWLSGFFGRQNNSTQVWTVETAQKEVKKYKKLFGDISLSNLDTAPKKLNSLLDGLEETKKNLQNTLSDGLLSTSEKEDIERSLKETTDSIDLANKALKDVGGKRKKKGDKSGNKNYDIERAKAVREQVRVIKEAADAFQYWREKVGDNGAWEHVQKEFGDVLQKIGITATNIEDVREHLNKIPQTKEYRAITDKKVKTEIDKEIAKDNDQYTRKDFERNTERFLSQTQIQLDSLTRAWELFNDVRESTGNLELAVRISGVGGDGTRNLADDLKKKIQNDLAQIGVNAIPFDFNFSDKDIKEEVEKAFERFKPQKPTDENDKRAMNEYNDKLSEYQSKIKGFIEIYKKWRNLQRDVTAKDLKIFADLLGKTEDYGSKLNQLRDKLSQTLESINLSEGTPEQKSIAARRAVASEEWEEAQLSAEFANLFNNAVAMSKSAFESEASYIEGLLNDLFELGLISPEKMNEWRDKISKARIDYSTSGFLGIKGATGAFLGGGYQGLIDYRKSKRNKIQEELSRLNTNSQEYKDKEKELKVQNQLIKKNEEAAKSMEQVMTAANTLKGAFDLLADLFNNMGATGMGDAMSDASSVLGGAMQGASALSALGPWGMAAGAGLGLVSGLFALHDKSLQRQIDALKDNNAAIEANTDAIKRARERTLGYDTGQLRKAMANTYRSMSNSDAKNALIDYYTTNGYGTGYKQELSNLKKERENYIEMYNLEADKKNESGEALLEYKTRVAELDDQILHFSEDLSKDLFGIDLKGWASQIGDSLMTAFENGEDAAEAFKDTVQDIMRQVLHNMLSIGIIEPMMKRLQTKLFGENGRPGLFDASNPEGTIDAAMKEITAFFGDGGDGQKMIEATKTFYERWEEFMNGYGLTLSQEDSSSSMSKGIKGITEQTADILSAYVNSIRADVSVIRTMDAKVLQEYWPSQIRLMTSGTQSLTNIEQHTLAIMRSSDAIERSNQAILDNINGLKNKSWRVPVS